MMKQIESKRIEEADWETVADIGRQLDRRLGAIDGHLRGIDDKYALLLVRANITMGTFLALLALVIAAAVVAK